MPEPGSSDILGIGDPNDRTGRVPSPSVDGQKKGWGIFRREGRKSRPKIDAEHHHGPLLWAPMTIGAVILLLVVAFTIAFSVYWAGRQRDRENAALVEKVDGAVSQIDPKLAVAAKQLDERLASWSIKQEAKANEVNGKVGEMEARVTDLAKRIPGREQVLQWTLEERRAWVNDQRNDPGSTLNTIAAEQAAKEFGRQREQLARELAPRVAEHLGSVTIRQVREEYREMLRRTRLEYEQGRDGDGAVPPRQ
ncbi:MAG: hypothetical protein Q8P35_01165 [Candidatus Yanofskybacteria bacterium]|nr:hypothetical protein [Candidatus Yanofskybacteria bacterium]